MVRQQALSVQGLAEFFFTHLWASKPLWGSNDYFAQMELSSWRLLGIYYVPNQGLGALASSPANLTSALSWGQFLLPFFFFLTKDHLLLSLCRSRKF